MTSTYPSYKPTPIPWLPQIPDHWNMRKAKHLFKERSEKGFPNEPLLAATQTKGVVFKEEYETRTVTAQKDFHLLKLVKKEDFVISLRSFQGGIEFAYQQGIISPAYTVFREKNNNEVDKGFYRHLFKSNPFISSLTLFVTGIREGQNIEYGEFKDSLLPLPPLPEQTAIANYLDAKTDEINTFIAKKQKLIALLKEQKQAIINELLQDKDGKWEKRKLKYVAKINSAKSNSNIKLKEEDRVVFLPMERVSENGEIDCTLLKPYSELKNGFTFFEKGDIIIAKITPCFENGKGALLENLPTDVGFGSTEFHTIRANKKKILPHFLKWLVFNQHFRSLGEYFMVGSAGQKRVPSEFISNFVIALPDLEEQQIVLTAIQRETTYIDNAVSHIEKEIELVKELKQSLIAEVVTGKIKVIS